MKSKEQILKEHYEKLVQKYPGQYKTWGELQIWDKPSIRTMYEAMDEYAAELLARLAEAKEKWKGEHSLRKQDIASAMDEINLLRAELDRLKAERFKYVVMDERFKIDEPPKEQRDMKKV